VELTTERINNNEAKSNAATQQEKERKPLANFAAANKPLVHEPESEDHSQ
jgi:hypothetical protein